MTRPPDPPRKPADEPDPLGRYDLIVVGDVDPANLPPESLEAARRLRRRARAGRSRSCPAPGSGRPWPAKARGPCSPCSTPAPWPSTRRRTRPDHPALPPGVPLMPTPEALDAPTPGRCSRSAKGSDGPRDLGGAPRLPWVIAGKAKPSASTLATSSGRLARTKGPRSPRSLTGWARCSGSAPTPPGAGGSGWATRSIIGSGARWSAGRARGCSAVGNRVVRHGPIKPRVGEGEGVRLQARVAEDAAGVPPDLLMAARIFRRDSSAEAVAVVPLRAVPGQPRVFEGVAPGLPARGLRRPARRPATGRRISQSQGAGPIPEAPLEVIPRDTPERVELAATREPLDRLALATGGKVFRDFEAAQLPGVPQGEDQARRAVRGGPPVGPPGDLGPLLC